MNIHPTAVIDASAELGENVTVGPGAVISAHTKIGNGSKIGPNAVIHEYTSMGVDCRVHGTAVIGDIPQDLAFKDVPSFVRIGDRVTMREGVTIHRGTKEHSKTVVGNDCYLMANSHLAHNVILGEKVILVNGVLIAGYVELGDGVFFGGGAAIHQFCKVGRLAMIGGNGSISKDVPPFCTTHSGELNLVSGLNVVGLRRAGFNPNQRKTVKRCFETIYLQGLNISQAIEKLQECGNEPIAGEFRDFIEKSDRGLCALAKSSKETK